MTLPDSYDFNEHYAPLDVLNQRQTPDCVLETRATLLSAYRRVWDGVIQTYQGTDVTWDTTSSAFYMDGIVAGSRYRFEFAPSDYWSKHGATSTDQSPEALKEALIENAVIEFTVPAYSKAFLGVEYMQSSLPVVYPIDGDQPLESHDITGVGYTPLGLIVQNSWGLLWGCQGRAILSWEWIAAFKLTGSVYSYNGHGFDTVVLPAKPTPIPNPTPHPIPLEDKMVLIQKPGEKAIYAWTGGHLDHIPSMSVLTSMGYTLADVKHPPANDPVWTLPILAPGA